MTDVKRYVVQARFLGLDNNTTKGGKGTEYAIEVVLSDESLYTMYRSCKDILAFHKNLLRKFKVEAGYFKKEERVIPDCPIKQSIFGPQRAISDDKSFERLLSFYIKAIPGLPGALVKSDLVTEFFSLKESDLGTGTDKKKKPKKKSQNKIEVHDDSLITGPVALKSYYAVTDFDDKKTKFSFKEGTTVQVLQKDPGGWWMVDAQGLIGWAPASFLVPLNEDDEQEVDSGENLMENQNERVGIRYISISAYQASRDDELSFVRGAVVKVLHKYVDGWWRVRYNGGEGMVPGALFTKFSSRRQATVYVGKIRRKYTHRGTTRIVPTVKTTWMNSRYEPRRIEQAKKKQEAEEARENQDKKLSSASEVVEADPAAKNSSASKDSSPEAPSDSSEYRVCMAEYEGNGLIIKEGDNIEVLDDSENDWWYVMDSQGEKGWAPADYFQPVVGPDDALPAAELVFDDDEDDDKIDSMDELENDSMDIEDSYIVIKNYTKSSADELDLAVGQLACVIDDSDPDVWYVNMEGKEGWVPSNVLELVNDDDIASSSEGTPSGVRSGTVSADNSDLSDDGMSRYVKRRRPRQSGDGFRPIPRPRSRVIHKSPSPQPELSSRQMSSSQDHLSVDNNSDSEAYHNSLKIKSVAERLDQLEKEAEEAERLAREARLKAQFLRDQLNLIST